MVVIIKMKGLPWEATAREIRAFYRGLDISEEDIHLAPSPEGKASGYAFACFQKDEEARKAMHRNGKFVGKRYIELILSSQTEMEKILKEGVRKRREDFVDNPRALDVEKKANGLRENSKSTRDISRRSRSRSPIRKSGSGDGSKSRREHVGTNHVNGRRSAYERDSARTTTNGSANGLSTTGREVVRREREKDRRKDSDNRSGLGRTSTREGRDSRLDTTGTRRVSEGGQFTRETFSSNNRSRRDSASVDGAVGNSTWVVMTGLPYSVTELEVLEFFKGLDVLSVHFMLHTAGTWAGKKNGTAFVEFKSVGDCIQGTDRNRQFIRKRYVGVKRCSLEEVLIALDAKSTDNWLFQEPNMTGGSFSQESTAYSLGNMNGDNQNLLSPGLGIAAVNSIGMNSAGNLPSPLNAGMAMEGPMTPINQLAAGANISVNDINAGCVIGIRNLPSTVSAEEILDFFYGFPIIPDSIRIHYLAPGRSSGDAMVTLPTSGEAYSAIEQLNSKPVGKRKVQLFLV